MSALTVENVRKEFGDLVAVEDVSLTVEEGELLCLLGPSGCGKSTTLRMIAGLETPTDGSIYIRGEEVTSKPAYDRDSSMVFQSWALFPTKTVLENVAFGLKMEGVSKEERHKKARETLELMEISEYADSKPEELSGGQQQRVALARSLTVSPELLLLDEPLSNLDKRLKEQMQLELKNIHQRFERTMIHVTHDQDEAFTLADRIGIMNDGRLVQVGTPREVYRNPKNQFVEDFLGETSIVTGTAADTDDGVTVDIGDSFSLPLDTTAESISPQESVSVSIRPEVVDLDTSKSDNAQELATDGSGMEYRLSGTVENILYRGSLARYYIDVNGTELFVETSTGDGQQYDEGDQVSLSMNSSDLLFFDSRGNRIKTGS